MAIASYGPRAYPCVKRGLAHPYILGCPGASFAAEASAKNLLRSPSEPRRLQDPLRRKPDPPPAAHPRNVSLRWSTSATMPVLSGARAGEQPGRRGREFAPTATDVQLLAVRRST